MGIGHRLTFKTDCMYAIQGEEKHIAALQNTLNGLKYELFH